MNTDRQEAEQANQPRHTGRHAVLPFIGFCSSPGGDMEHSQPQHRLDSRWAAQPTSSAMHAPFHHVAPHAVSEVSALQAPQCEVHSNSTQSGGAQALDSICAEDPNTHLLTTSQPWFPHAFFPHNKTSLAEPNAGCASAVHYKLRQILSES